MAKYLLALVAAVSSLGAWAGTVVYYHNDIAGSPVVATDESRNVIWRESYRPYGERLTNALASVDNRIWFTSRRQDAETGLVYMGARYYDPVIGRFISKDPAGFDEANLHSHNRYAYANNNPYRFRDPDGRTPVDVGFALWDGGRFLGAAAAWSVGAITGNKALRDSGAQGMQENALDAGVSVGAILLPVSPNVARAAKVAADSIEALKLQKALASESQMGEIGKVIAGAGAKDPLDTIGRILKDHGGAAGDWAKKSSSTFQARDGTRISTHWLENAKTGQRVEFKTIVYE